MRSFQIFLLLSVLSGFAALPPLCDGSSPPKTPCSGWRSLQQVRSLIPERIWAQEFTIKVKREAFRKTMQRWSGRYGMDCSILGRSHAYLLHSTITGENVRLLDHYQEFQWSPFWKTPAMVQRLQDREHEIMKEGQ